MKRFSIYFLYGAAIICSITMFEVYMGQYEWRQAYRKTYETRKDNLDTEALASLQIYEASHNVDQLSRFLEGRRRARVFNYWVLYKDGTVVNTSIPPEELRSLKFDLTQSSSATVARVIRDSAGYDYAVEGLADGHQLVLGLVDSEGEYVAVEFSEQKKVIARYLFGLFVLCMGVFAFFFRDILRAIQEVARGGTRAFRGLRAGSKEADLLLRGFASYDDRNQELKAENEKLTWQVLPSLRTELASGREPPYDFECTLVRTDINNFTKIFNEHPVDEFMETINQFFTDVSHVVSRYNGLIHEFVGDEVIFYFKDETAGDSVAAALSAIRDINEVAIAVHKSTLEKRGYPFTVKSSFARGRLRFGPLVNGLSLSGPVLIETVRILSHVQEKDGNVVVFDSRHMGSVESIAYAEPYINVRLKGFTEEARLFVYRGHVPVGNFLDGKADRFRYFRSDDDLSAIFAWLRRQDADGDPRPALHVIRGLRDVRVSGSNGVPQKVLLMWIEELLEAIEKGIGATDTRVRILASILRLTENLVPPSEFSEAFEAAFRRALSLKDRRVIANALDALTLFRKGREPELDSMLIRHPDNRVAANALVLEGARSISPFVVKRLQKMMTSRNVANVASALYAFGEIAAHHRARDPIYFNTQVDFLSLADSMMALVTHDDVRIRRQAFVAARKLGDQDVIRTVIETVRTQPGLLAEAREHLRQAVDSQGGSSQAA